MVRGVLSVFLLGTCLSAASIAAQARATITVFDVPGASTTTGTLPVGMNAQGDVAGYFTDRNRFRGFIRAADGEYKIFNADKKTQTYPYGINSSGVVTIRPAPIVPGSRLASTPSAMSKSCSSVRPMSGPRMSAPKESVSKGSAKVRRSAKISCVSCRSIKVFPACEATERRCDSNARS